MKTPEPQPNASPAGSTEPCPPPRRPPSRRKCGPIPPCAPKSPPWRNSADWSAAHAIHGEARAQRRLLQFADPGAHLRTPAGRRPPQAPAARRRLVARLAARALGPRRRRRAARARPVRHPASRTSPQTQVVSLYVPNPSVKRPVNYNAAADATVLTLDGLGAFPDDKTISGLQRASQRQRSRTGVDHALRRGRQGAARHGHGRAEPAGADGRRADANDECRSRMNSKKPNDKQTAAQDDQATLPGAGQAAAVHVTAIRIRQSFVIRHSSFVISSPPPSSLSAPRRSPPRSAAPAIPSP